MQRVMAPRQRAEEEWTTSQQPEVDPEAQCSLHIFLSARLCTLMFISTRDFSFIKIHVVTGTNNM